MPKELNLESPDRTEDITIDEVRSLPTFKDWSDERILELIRTLKTLSIIMYNNWSKGVNNGREIASDNSKQINIAA